MKLLYLILGEIRRTLPDFLAILRDRLFINDMSVGEFNNHSAILKITAPPRGY